MEGVNKNFGDLSVRKETALEKLPFEILEEILSYFPRNDRLRVSMCSPKIRRHNEDLTWKSILVDIGDPPDFPDRTKREKHLFNNLTHLQTTLLKHRHLVKHTVKLSLKVSRCLTYEKSDQMKVLKHFSSVKELSLMPPPHNFVVPIKPCSLRLDFHYDRSVFWALSCYEPPPLDLSPYFQMPDLRKLQVEHISFEPEMHQDSFARLQEPSPIEDLRFIDCSPQTVGVLTKVLLSVKRLSRLTVEMNVPWPVVKNFDNDSRARDWDRPGGQDFKTAISPHSSSLEELIIAFSDGASFFVRPAYAFNPHARIPQSVSTVYTPTRPVIPPIGSFEKFANLKRLAIPESLLFASHSTHIRSLHNLLPEALTELQLQFPIVNGNEPLTLTAGEELRIERLHALADCKPTRLPRLDLVVCWYQPYASSSGANLDHDAGYGLSWDNLREHFEGVGVRLEQVFGAFFEDTPFGTPLDIEHSKRRPPGFVRQGGNFVRDPARAGLYFDLETQDVF